MDAMKTIFFKYFHETTAHQPSNKLRHTKFFPHRFGESEHARIIY